MKENRLVAHLMVVMNEVEMRKTNCFCALCKAPRKFSKRKHISFLSLLSCFVFSNAAGFAIWGAFEPRSLALTAGLAGIVEIGVLLRWRMSIACGKCGFDPVLYKRDKKLAYEKVRRHMQEIANSPMASWKKANLNSRLGPIDFPDAIAESEPELEEAVVRDSDPTLSLNKVVSEAPKA